MGEITEMMLEGILCQSCGQTMDDVIEDDPTTVGPDGYPRFCLDCNGDPETNYATKKKGTYP